MEAKYTPEPWKITKEMPREVWSKEGWHIAHCRSVTGDENPKANARRIAACVNACEGIPNEVLERGFLMAAIEEEQKVWVAANRYKRKESRQ